MISIEKHFVGEIPVLNIAKSDIFETELPTVIFQHGFTSAMEHNLAIAYLLAEKGFRTLLPDALMHGEREGDVNSFQRNIAFWDIVVNGIFDVERVINFFCDLGLTDKNRVGMSGTSMGGIITFGSLLQYPWIKAAVSLMGSPGYVEYANILLEQVEKQPLPVEVDFARLSSKIKELAVFDITQQPEKLAGRPLFLWHSEVDPVVPFSITYEFYSNMKQNHYLNKNNIQILIDKKSGHKVTREATLAAVEWFAKYL